MVAQFIKLAPPTTSPSIAMPFFEGWEDVRKLVERSDEPHCGLHLVVF
jgi:hypothetical protein